jgi:phage-related protein
VPIDKPKLSPFIHTEGTEEAFLWHTGTKNIELLVNFKSYLSTLTQKHKVLSTVPIDKPELSPFVHAEGTEEAFLWHAGTKTKHF